jgi:hypothetical protein
MSNDQQHFERRLAQSTMVIMPKGIMPMGMMPIWPQQTMPAAAPFGGS